MRTQRQERQAAETRARKADRAFFKELGKAGYILAIDLIPVDCTAREIDFYADGKRIGRGLLQRDGSYGCSGVGEWGLVPPGTTVRGGSDEGH